MNNNFYAFRRLIFSLVVLLLVSCNLKFKEPLKVGTNVWPGYEMFYLARSLDLYKENRLKLVELPSELDVVEAFNQHLLDVAAVSLGEALLLAQRQPEDIRVILITDVSHGADAVLTKVEINGLAEIKGKRIGIEKSVGGKFLLDALLQEANLLPEDITIVPLYKNEHISAYKEDKIDILMTSEPIKTQLTKLGAKALFDSSKIPHKMVRVLITHRNVIDERKIDLKKLVDGYFEALNYFNSNRQEASFKMAPRLMIKSSEISSIYKGVILSELKDNRKLLLGEDPILIVSSEKVMKWMLEKKILLKSILVEQLIDAQFLPEQVKS